MWKSGLILVPFTDVEIMVDFIIVDVLSSLFLD